MAGRNARWNGGASGGCSNHTYNGGEKIINNQYMFFVTALNIYPVKSLGGFTVTEAKVTATGFEHDRRWMLVDRNGKFMTQRDFKEMALLQTAIIPEGLYISHKHFPEKNIT